MYRAKESRRRQRYSAKSRYKAGSWNVNTVLMGGLGGDPECSSDEGTAIHPSSPCINTLWVLLDGTDVIDSEHGDVKVSV